MVQFLRPMVGLLLLSAGLATSGCAWIQAYSQRQAIEHARFMLKSVAIEGFDLGGLNVVVTLALQNPTDTPIVLDRLDYALFVNDRPAVSGYSDQKTSVPPHDERPVAFRTSLRYADVGLQARTLIEQRGIGAYRLDGTGHFDTPFGTVDYPVHLLGGP